MLFGKKKKDQPAKPATIKEALAQQEAEPEVEITEGSAGDDDDVVSEEGADTTSAADTSEVTSDGDEDQRAQPFAVAKAPRDISELESTRGYLNFGSVLIPALKNQKVRLDVDQKTKRVVSLTIGLGQASLQLQAFSAPKSGGIWDDVRSQIEESVLKQKGRARHVEGRFGTELHARVPTTLKDGRQGWRAARFIGYEGQRWFLRGVIGGRGAIDRKASQAVENLFAHIVVNRGEDPLPPRELLPLKPPPGTKRVRVPRQGSAAEAQNSRAAESSQPRSRDNSGE
ncbi:DUF3710 domain-containing protein [Nesterenkonia alba]|uniref:DUF3710 domain-containing protein n=1 Tax=Nesterenkonia alba TaxID=515814 RepID=UPI0003B455CD|nr:DUF3710 domain-containing protein [Nesterenkonia alba]